MSNCISFPGPGDNHIYTFNPMHEFVHNFQDHVNVAFDKYRVDHKKKYYTDVEHHQRKENFRQNLR